MISSNRIIEEALSELSRWIEQRGSVQSLSEWRATRDQMAPYWARLQRALDAEELTTATAALLQIAERFEIARLRDCLAPSRAAEDSPVYRGSPTFRSSPLPNLESRSRGSAFARPEGLAGSLRKLRQFLEPAAEAQRTELAVQAPARVEVMAAFAVEVRADPAALLDAAGGLALEFPKGQGLDVEVELTSRPPSCFEFLGATVGVLRIQSDGRSARLCFDLRAVQPGQHRLELIFRHRGLLRTHLVKAIHVTSPAEPTTAEPVQAVAACRIYPAAKFDGLLLQTQAILGGPGGACLRVLLEQPRGPQLTHTIGWTQQDQSSLAELCRQLPALMELSDAPTREHRLRGIGAKLAKRILGGEICDVLSDPELPEGTPLHIESHDSWVPWELLLPLESYMGESVFLGERFAISRSLLAGTACDQLGEGPVVLVAPSDSGLNPQTERQVLSRLHEQPLQELLTVGELQRWLCRPVPCGVLHFVCHAESERSAVLPEVLLLQNDELFRHTDVPTAQPDAPGSLARALVFVNACQGSLVERSLWGHHGWADAFLRGGASAFISSAWTIGDRSASRFAEQFYQRALLGLPLAEAARRARRSTRELGAFYALGYTVYASPQARLRV